MLVSCCSFWLILLLRALSRCVAVACGTFLVCPLALVVGANLSVVGRAAQDCRTWASLDWFSGLPAAVVTPAEGLVPAAMDATLSALVTGAEPVLAGAVVVFLLVVLPVVFFSGSFVVLLFAEGFLPAAMAATFSALVSPAILSP